MGLTLSTIRIDVTEKIKTKDVAQKSAVVSHLSPLYGKSQKHIVVLIIVSLQVPWTHG